MKTDIHPQYYNDAKVTCSCGNTFTVGATAKELNVEICSNCHPFFTGNEKVIDTAGRVEKFKARKAAATVSLKKKPVRKDVPA
jgi:large subunit ribosomal protein L31